MGYVGPGVVNQLRAAFPNATLVGYDMGYFSSCLTNVFHLPELALDQQLFGDLRFMPEGILNGVDVIVHLAAISNDPMGMQFEDLTMDVNYRASIRLAHMAKRQGVKAFVFASSCSMYGAGGDGAKAEDSELNPLTAYARSKVFTERDLRDLADESFTITCLRFATACGMSNRLRLDLVLNDFVAGAVSMNKVSILSDGSPWRPLIHVADMARAICWAVTRDAAWGGRFLAVNTGSNHWNYQVIELAEALRSHIPGLELSVNKDAAPDKRSYRVNFDLFESLAPNHQPQHSLQSTIAELHENLLAMNFNDADFRNSLLMRLKVLNQLKDTGLLNSQLSWTMKQSPRRKPEPQLVG